eukprot:7389359-Prymnesium_polylepis.2
MVFADRRERCSCVASEAGRIQEKSGNQSYSSTGLGPSVSPVRHCPSVRRAGSAAEWKPYGLLPVPSANPTPTGRAMFMRVLRRFATNGSRSCSASLDGVPHFGKLLRNMDGIFVTEDDGSVL